MILEGLIGGLLRIAPELMKQVDRANERKHELAMFGLQIEADKTKGQIALAQADSQMAVSELQAVIEATKAQAIITGVKWVDAINILVRPLITLLWAGLLYPAALICKFVVIIHPEWEIANAFLAAFWGEPEMSLVMMCVSFYFVGRVYERKGR